VCVGGGGGGEGDQGHDGVVITCRQCILSGCACHAFVVARIQMIFRKLATLWGGGWPGCGSLVLCVMCCGVLCCAGYAQSL